MTSENLYRISIARLSMLCNGNSNRIVCIDDRRRVHRGSQNDDRGLLVIVEKVTFRRSLASLRVDASHGEDMHDELLVGIS